MAKAVNLEAEINKILEKYGDDISEHVKEAAKEVAQKGAKAVKSNSKASFNGTGKYASGWTSRMETGRYSAQGTIYNKSQPGLPHLLEKGHALRGGGRTTGVEHIKPVEEEVIRLFEEAIKKAI